MNSTIASFFSLLTQFIQGNANFHGIDFRLAPSDDWIGIYLYTTGARTTSDTFLIEFVGNDNIIRFRKYQSGVISKQMTFNADSHT